MRNLKKLFFWAGILVIHLLWKRHLNLKEISYIFAQCYPAGELKHGPLALS